MLNYLCTGDVHDYVEMDKIIIVPSVKSAVFKFGYLNVMNKKNA